MQQTSTKIDTSSFKIDQKCLNPIFGGKSPYSRQSNERGVSYDFPKIFLAKLSEISIITMEIIDEVQQISLRTTCTTKLHRYYRVNLHFLDFHQNIFPEIPLPLYYLRESEVENEGL